jgi:hypothetical protein
MTMIKVLNISSGCRQARPEGMSVSQISEERFAALEARLGQLEDKEAIRDAISRYSFNIDLGREEAYLAGWADDAILDMGATPIVLEGTDGEKRDISGTGDSGVAPRGKEALRQMMFDPEGANKKYIENRALHTVCNLHVGVEGNDAWAECYSVVFIRTDSAMLPSTGGYNHWKLRRVDGDWLVVSRRRRDVGGAEWGGETIKSYLAHHIPV